MIRTPLSGLAALAAAEAAHHQAERLTPSRDHYWVIDDWAPRVKRWPGRRGTRFARITYEEAEDLGLKEQLLHHTDWWRGIVFVDRRRLKRARRRCIRFTPAQITYGCKAAIDHFLKHDPIDNFRAYYGSSE